MITELLQQLTHPSPPVFLTPHPTPRDLSLGVVVHSQLHRHRPASPGPTNVQRGRRSFIPTHLRTIPCTKDRKTVGVWGGRPLSSVSITRPPMHVPDPTQDPRPIGPYFRPQGYDLFRLEEKFVNLMCVDLV